MFVRYFVTDLDEAVTFYRERLGFEEVLRPSPSLAILAHGDLRLLLNVPGGPGAGAPMPDGATAEPGGWNRFVLQVPDLDATIEALRQQGATFRNDMVVNAGFKHILLEDPAGNLVELSQPPAS